MYSTALKLSDIDIEQLLQIAVEAGEAILKIYRTPFDVIQKDDGSPLTLADKLSNEIITTYLFNKYSIPILSEENEDIPYTNRKNWKQYWCIDPLDGTKEFVHKRREFTVNIALIEDGRPILGIVYAPVFEDLFYAMRGEGSFFIYKNKKTKLYSHPAIAFENGEFIHPKKSHLKVILSRSHSDGFRVEDYLSNDRYTLQTIAMGSSLKFCRIAQGTVDLNIRTRPTSEWDTAAAQIILEEAGHHLVKYDDGTPLDYNKENLLNPYFVAY